MKQQFKLHAFSYNLISNSTSLKPYILSNRTWSSLPFSSPILCLELNFEHFRPIYQYQPYLSSAITIHHVLPFIKYYVLPVTMLNVSYGRFLLSIATHFLLTTSTSFFNKSSFQDILASFSEFNLFLINASFLPKPIAFSLLTNTPCFLNTTNIWYNRAIVYNIITLYFGR